MVHLYLATLRFFFKNFCKHCAYREGRLCLILLKASEAWNRPFQNNAPVGPAYGHFDPNGPNIRSPVLGNRFQKAGMIASASERLLVLEDLVLLSSSKCCLQS